MCAIAFDMIFINILELTPFFRPIRVSVVPIYTRKVTLSQHLILFQNIRVLKVTKSIVCFDKICEILIVTDRKREFDGDTEILDINLVDNAASIDCPSIIKEIHFNYIRCHIISVINLIWIHCEFSNLCDELVTKRDRRSNEVCWGNLYISLLLPLDVIRCRH